MGAQSVGRRPLAAGYRRTVGPRFSDRCSGRLAYWRNTVSSRTRTPRPYRLPRLTRRAGLEAAGGPFMGSGDRRASGGGCVVADRDRGAAVSQQPAHISGRCCIPTARHMSSRREHLDARCSSRRTVGRQTTAAASGRTTSPRSLAIPTLVHPGDTVWLRGGTYKVALTSHLIGRARRADRRAPVSERARHPGCGIPYLNPH